MENLPWWSVNQSLAAVLRPKITEILTVPRLPRPGTTSPFYESQEELAEMFAEAREQIREAIRSWPKSPLHPLASLRVDLHHCRRQIRDKEMEEGQTDEALLQELRERASLYSDTLTRFEAEDKPRRVRALSLFGSAGGKPSHGPTTMGPRQPCLRPPTVGQPRASTGKS